MRRIALAVLAVGGLLAQPAEALTTRDIIELSRAGLTEEVLLALIEVDRGVYDIDPATLKSLKTAGVSERVILALVKSGREAPVLPNPVPPVEPAGPPAPQPQVVVIEHREPEVREVAVPVPVYMTFPAFGSRHRFAGIVQTLPQQRFVPFQWGPPPYQPTQLHKPKEPVYWGFGGKRRPDSWDPAPHERHDRK
jgi:hypothetical protein